MITGSIVALVTPMHSGSLSIDWSSLKALIEWHIAEGTNAIVSFGPTFLSAFLRVSFLVLVFLFLYLYFGCLSSSRMLV